MEDVDEVIYRWFKQARVMSANNILMDKAKHKLDGRIKNYSGDQGHSFGFPPLKLDKVNLA